MRNRSRGQEHSQEAEINLTPLIDVVFVVLIMFILVAPMLEVDKVALASGTSKEDKEMTSVQEASSISIKVLEDNSIWLNAKRVKGGELASLLKEAKRTNPKRIPQLLHDKKAQFGTYQQVKNAVEEAGFLQMDVILLPSSK